MLCRDATAERFGAKNDAKKSHGNSLPAGQFPNYPTKSFVNQLGSDLGYNGGTRVWVHVPLSRAHLLRHETFLLSTSPRHKGNNYSANRHLMQLLCFACVVALLSVTVAKAL